MWKHERKAGSTGDGSGKRSLSALQAKAKVKTEEVALFGFTSIPNFLDDSERSEQEDGRAGKRKRQTQAFLRRLRHMRGIVVNICRSQSDARER